nr:limonene-1,2-epoxide hydrolase family protein [Sphingomonas sp. CDS-1]
MAVPEKDEMQAKVERFFKACEAGTARELVDAFDQALADNCVYENSGIAPVVGKPAILRFVEESAEQIDVATMHVTVRQWGFGPASVFTERVDDNRNARGESTHVVPICGIMIFDADGKIVHWRDYYDPGGMLDHFAGTSLGQPANEGADRKA